MTPKVKRLVNHLYFDCEISRPKLIEKKIHNKYKSKIEKDPNEAIPALDKIQNYIKFLKKEISSANNVHDIREFVDKHTFTSEHEKDDFFCFGANYGNGTDENHFLIFRIILKFDINIII